MSICHCCGTERLEREFRRPHYRTGVMQTFRTCNYCSLAMKALNRKNKYSERHGYTSIEEYEASFNPVDVKEM